MSAASAWAGVMPASAGIVRGAGPLETTALIVLPLSTMDRSGTCWPATVKDRMVPAGIVSLGSWPATESLSSASAKARMATSMRCPASGGSSDGAGPSDT